jgi:septal ring factor EnvC (AmiA/AmiB activator)
MKLSHIFRVSAAAALGVLLVSCGDDPELVKKRDEQKNKLRQVEADLAVLREKAQSLPQDRTDDLKKLKATSDENLEKISDLEAQIEQLRKQKNQVEADQDTYRRKYVVR